MSRTPRLTDGGAPRVLAFADLDAALEWCENRVIARTLLGVG